MFERKENSLSKKKEISDQIEQDKQNHYAKFDTVVNSVAPRNLNSIVQQQDENQSFLANYPFKMSNIPPQIKKALKENGMLYSDAEYKKINEKIKEIDFSLGRVHSDRRYTKAELKLPYSVMRYQNSHFAIFKGLKHETDESKNDAGPYQFILGTGHEGTKVKWIQDLETGKLYALKIISKYIDKLEKQYHFLKRVNAAKCKISRDNKQKIRQVEIVMELAPGKNLDIQYNQLRNLSLMQLVCIAIKAIKATQAIHQAGILHRDIKMNNFIFDLISEQLTLIDFDISVDMSEADINKTRPYTNGTYEYMHPKAFSQGIQCIQTDIYQLGITLARLFNLSELTKRIERDNNGETEEFKIYKPKLKLKLNNSLIPNDEMCLKIFNFILKMTDENLFNIPSLDDCLNFFENILKSMREGKNPAYYRKIKIIDINEILKTRHDSAERRLIIEALQDREVYLTDTSGKLNKESIDQLIDELQTQSVIIRGVFIRKGDNANFIKQIQDYVDHVEENSERIYECVNRDSILKDAIRNEKPIIRDLIIENELIFSKDVLDFIKQENKLEFILKEAVIADKKDLIKKLLEYGANPNTFANDFPLLHIISDCEAYANSVEIAKELIEAKASINLPDKDNFTPLMAAAIFDNQKVVEYLLTVGADPLVVDAKEKKANDYTSQICTRRILIIAELKELIKQNNFTDKGLFTVQKQKEVALALIQILEKNDSTCDDVDKLKLSNYSIAINSSLRYYFDAAFYFVDESAKTQNTAKLDL